MLKTVARFFDYPFMLATLGTTALGLAGGIITVCLPLSLGIYFESVFGMGSGRNQVMGRMGIHHLRLIDFAWIFTGLVLLKFVISWSFEYYSRKLAGKVSGKIRLLVFEDFLNKDTIPITPKSRAGWLYRLTGDSTDITQFYRKAMIGGIRDLLLILIFAVVLLGINKILTITLIAGSLLIFSIQGLIGNRYRHHVQNRKAPKNKLYKTLAAHIDNVRALRMPGRRETEIKRFRRKILEMQTANNRYELRRAFSEALFPALIYAQIGFFLFLAMRLVEDHADEGPVIFSFLLILMMLVPAFRRLGKVPAMFFKAMPSIRKLAETIEVRDSNANIHGSRILNENSKLPDEDSIPLYGRTIYEAIAPWRNKKMTAIVSGYLCEITGDAEVAEKLMLAKPEDICSDPKLYARLQQIRTILHSGGYIKLDKKFLDKLEPGENN